MRVLVTGGTGFLGAAIVHALLEQAHTVILFGRTVSGATAPGVAAVSGDVRDAPAFCAAAQGCDALVHAAGLVSIWQARPGLFDEVNVGGLENAVAAAREARLRRIVYTSSFLALPPAGRDTPMAANDYQRTKAAALARARAHAAAGAPLVVLVPGVIYGPGPRTEGNLVGRLLADHLAGRLPGIVGGRRIWSFAFVREVAAAHVAALECNSPRAEYRLGGENVPQRRIFDWLSDRTGRRPPRELPMGLAVSAGWLEERRVRLVGGHPLITRGAAAIFKYDWPVDSHDARRDLGYVVRPLADGLEQTLAALRASGEPAA
jgi:dihydroflavonol-4-reductase